MIWPIMCEVSLKNIADYIDIDPKGLAAARPLLFYRDDILINLTRNIWFILIASQLTIG